MSAVREAFAFGHGFPSRLLAFRSIGVDGEIIGRSVFVKLNIEKRQIEKG
jgi:hypothetical protein